MADLDLEQELDRLFSEPPESFVAARTVLVKALKASGNAADADRVKGWRRPSRAIWALNRLALADDDSVADLVAAATSAGALQSSGAGGLREAIAELRQTTQRATAAAVETIGSVRPSDRAEVAAALLAIVADPEALGLLARGRLLEVPESGLGGFGSTASDLLPSPPPGPSRSQPIGRPRKSAKKRAQAAGGDQAARDRDLATRRAAAAAVTTAEVAVAVAEAEHRRTVADLEAADGEHLQVSARLREAQAALEEAEREVTSATAATEAAQRDATAAADALVVARATLAAAEATLADAPSA